MIRHIMGLSEIAASFDAALVDQYGLLHDGARLYPYVAETIERLQQSGKSLVVMTNSGKRSQANRSRLAGMGLGLLPHQVLSSGEVAYQSIADGSLAPPFARGREVFVVGKEGDEYGFDGLGLSFVAEAEAAEFILILGSNAPATGLAQYREMLAPAALKRIPALCCNPDLEMLTSTGTAPAPGAIARAYEELGGNVTYVGKPYLSIYDRALGLAEVQAARAIAAGDSILHDIAGARNSGIASVLVLTGLSAGLSSADLAAQCRTAGAEPDWIMPAFTW